MPPITTKLTDALTEVRKRDWGRMVRQAAIDDVTFVMSDPDLERSVVLAAVEHVSELVTSVAGAERQ